MCLAVTEAAHSLPAADVAEVKTVSRRCEERGGGVYSVQGSLEDYPMVREALSPCSGGLASRHETCANGCDLSRAMHERSSRITKGSVS